MQRCDIFKEVGLKVGYHQRYGLRKLNSNRVRAAKEADEERKQAEKTKRTIMSVQEENGDERYQVGAF